MTQQSNLSVTDTLSTAVQASIVPNREYLLQGSIMDTSFENLIHRLRGLCDNVDAGLENFTDYEACFTLPSRNIQSNQNAPLQLRVRRAQDYDAPYQLRYLGQPESDRRKPTIVRSCIDIACTSSIVDYLTELGARIEFEYRISGYLFRKGRMKITVAKVFKNSTVTEPISQSYLVELSVAATNGQGQEAIGEEMKAFAEQLKPLVHLEKIDYKSMGPMP